jgi:hypothetical protein
VGLDVAPDHIEDIYSELEDTPDPSPVFARLSAHESGWLALHILDQALKDRENISDEIESELRVRPSRLSFALIS